MGEGGVDHARAPGAAAARPRVGVLLVTSGWFREVGLQGADSGTTRDVAKAGAALVEALSAFSDPVCDGVVFLPAEAEAAARRMVAEQVDGVLLVPLMWCEDAIPLAALRILAGLPVVLWTWSPGPSLPEFVPFQLMIQGSGPVCTMQLSGMLRREGIPYLTVAGHAQDPETLRQVEWMVRAMAVRRALRGARVGLLPFPCEHMSSTWVDELGLRRRYGTEVRHLELERVRAAAAASANQAVREFREAVPRTGTRVEVDGNNLDEGIRYALALQRVMQEERLDALAMNDVISQMHESFGMRPCLSNPVLSGGGAVVSMEGDVGAAVAMLALRRFTGDSPFYTEPFSVDYAGGSLLMGHAGYHDPVNADPAVAVRVVADVEYESSDRFTGAVTLFKYRPGPVTAVNSTWMDGSLKWCCVQGQSMPGPARMEGNCHLVFRPSIPVRDFCTQAVDAGVSQHWVFVPGHRAREIALLCAVLDIRLQRLDCGPVPG